MSRFLRAPRGPRIALIESLGDIGIGTYTYELAEGLVACGSSVDVYGLPSSPVRDWPRRHAFRAELPVVSPRASRARAWVERRVGPGALARSLERQGYDWVWTQWPAFMGRTLFWRYARALRLPLVHTVHNVFPHERATGDLQRMRAVYTAAEALIVHSEHARMELQRAFPSLARRILVQPHGTYTCYPLASADGAAVRSRLAIPPDAVVVLAFGWIRPYKNIESLIEAMADARMPPVVLIVAGRETGYPGGVPHPPDPLGRIRALAERVGVMHRVRLIPGFTDQAATADLVIACDIVALPYFECWGSGQLLLAMTTGRYVVATAAGGMGEYLAHYGAHSLLRGTTAADIAEGLREAVARLPQITRADRATPPTLAWPAIARDTIEALARVRDTTAV